MSDDNAPIDPKSLRPALAHLLSRAKAAGADHADVIATHGRSLGMVVREGALEDIDSSEGKDIGLRVLVEGRQACVSSSDLSTGSLDALADRAVAMARLAPKDPYAALATPEQFSKDKVSLELFDDMVMSPEQLKARAAQVEAAILAQKGVGQAEGSSASWSTSGLYFMTSEGFESGRRSSRHDLSGMAIASLDGAMERDGDYSSARWFEDLKTPADIGERAGQRAVARLGAKQLPSGSMPVMFDRRIASGFVGALLSAVSGSSIARGVSFLKDHLGEIVLNESIDIIDDPFRVRGLASRPHDGEGLPVSVTKIINQGRLTTWLHNLSTAKQLGFDPTGHGARGIGGPPAISVSNVHMSAGRKSPEVLMKEIGTGLLVTEMFGPSLNNNTGDYSVGVSGFAIEQGEKTYPVNEITVAGNLMDMFKTLTPASDLLFERAHNAPSIVFEQMTVAGA